MKNIFTPERKIGIAIIALFTILWIILVFILFDTAHPNIKHRILVSGMATGRVSLLYHFCVLDFSTRRNHCLHLARYAAGQNSVILLNI